MIVDMLIEDGEITQKLFSELQENDHFCMQSKLDDSKFMTLHSVLYKYDDKFNKVFIFPELVIIELLQFMHVTYGHLSKGAMEKLFFKNVIILEPCCTSNLFMMAVYCALKINPRSIENIM